jgi:hypothetical protein
MVLWLASRASVCGGGVIGSVEVGVCVEGGRGRYVAKLARGVDDVEALGD